MGAEYKQHDPPVGARFRRSRPQPSKAKPMRISHGLLAILLAIPGAPVLASPAAAQEATISGRVTDLETGAAVTDAAVEVLGLEGAAATTNQNGAFRIPVPSGTYSIVVTRIGYETTRLDGIAARTDGAAPVTVALRSRALALNQIVVTVSRREEKELDAPASVSTLTGAQISRMIARTPAAHLRTLPGVDLATTGITQSY
ncbi:MAG: hypothetical protein F4059_09935, partial [Gemmatimonadetes bacterium]|nr:hypothetical protein [Gemmatimonadota bacterium]